MVHAGSRTHSRSHPVAISRSITFPFGNIDGFLTIIPHAHGLTIAGSSKAVRSVVVGVPLLVDTETSAPLGPFAIVHVRTHAAIAHAHAVPTAHAITVLHHILHHVFVHYQVIEPILFWVHASPDLLCWAAFSSTITTRWLPFRPFSTISGS